MAPDLWPRALEELKGQLPRSTFDILFIRSHGNLHDSTLRIQFDSEYAAAWVDARLLPIVQRTVDRVAGRHLTIVISVSHHARETIAAKDKSPPDGDPRIAAPEPFSIELAEYDTEQHGFVKVANYAARFWQPYLGSRPFGLWVTLRSFAFHAQHAVWPSIQTLADICADGNRHAILGRGARAGRAQLTGGLQILEREHIVFVKRRGSGRSLTYAFRVIASLPLLTPSQVSRLPARLADAHNRFLERSDLDLEEWSGTDCSSLLAGDSLVAGT